MAGFVDNFSTDDLSRYAETSDLGGFVIDTVAGTYKASTNPAATQLGAAVYDSTTGYFSDPASYAGSFADGSLQTIKVVDMAANDGAAAGLQLWVYESEATGSDPSGEALGFALYEPVVTAGLNYDTDPGWLFGASVFSEGRTQITLPSAPPFPCWIALRIVGGHAIVELWDQNPWTSTGTPLHSVSAVLHPPPPMVPAIQAFASGGPPLVLDDWNWNPPPALPPVNGDIGLGPHNVGIVRP